MHPSPKAALKQRKQLRCIGDSLWPVLADGDDIVVSPVDQGSVRPGDLLVFHFKEIVVCHRVLKVRQTVDSFDYYVKGDNTVRPDGWIRHKRVIGRIDELPHLRSQLLNQLYRRISLTQFKILEPILRNGPRDQDLFEIASPWQWWQRQKNGTLLPRSWILPPPEEPGPRLIPVDDSYEQAFHYEDLFPANTDGLPKRLKLAPPKEGPVLDLGGGEGRLTRSLVRAGYETHYVDFSPRMTVTAVLKAAQERGFDQIHWHLGDFQQYQPKIRFRTILALSSINCLPSEREMIACLQKLGTLLTEDGEIWMQVGNLSKISQFPNWLQNKWTFERQIHFGGKPRWVWSRSRMSPTGACIWEHAVSHDRIHYQLLHGEVHIRSQSDWEELAHWGGCEVLDRFPKRNDVPRFFLRLKRRINSLS